MGSGCPKCAVENKYKGRSEPEIAVAFELYRFFNIGAETSGVTLDGQTYRGFSPGVEDLILDLPSGTHSCDVIIRQHKLIVEFDGGWFHSEGPYHGSATKYEDDQRKTRVIQDAGWKVIRIREEPLPLISSTDVSVPKNQDPKLTVNAVLRKIHEILGVQLEGLDDYLKAPELLMGRASKALYQSLKRKKHADKERKTSTARLPASRR